MIYDCFLFYNEFELLELRLKVLKDVDKHVLVESSTTHTGKPKEYFYENNKDRFKEWEDKIIHIKVDDSPPQNKTYDVEVYQRNQIMRGLEGATAEDRIIIGDVDEIPDPRLVKRYSKGSLPVTFNMKLFYYYVNCLSDRTWDGSIMTPFDPTVTPQEWRAQARSGLNQVSGGWHFSYLGGFEGIKNKLASISDASTRIDAIGTDNDIRRKVESQKDLWDEGVSHKIIDIDAFCPPEVKEIVRKYPHVFYSRPA